LSRGQGVVQKPRPTANTSVGGHYFKDDRLTNKKITECVFNIDVLYRELEENLMRFHKMKLGLDHPHHAAVLRYNYIQVCSILDELDILHGEAKSDNYLKDTLYVLSPALKKLKQFNGLKRARNTFLAHFNRDKKKQFYPWWKSLKGLRLPRNPNEVRQLYALIYIINSLLVSRYYDELKEISIQFKDEEKEYFKWVETEEEKVKNEPNNLDDIKEETHRRFIEKDFKNVRMQYPPLKSWD